VITQATSISQNRTAENHTAELALLIEGLTARLQSGEPLNLDGVVREHPEHAEELQELLPAMSLLVNLSRPSGCALPQQNTDAGDSTAMPPPELGDFRIVREVGRGGMGVVYEAQQVSLGRRVALKVLPTTATLDPRQRERFKNEAKAVASLRHEHIVHVYGVGCEHGVHYYAMQFIEGQTLADVIRGRRSQEAGARNLEPGARGHKSGGQAEDSVPNTQYVVPTKPIAAPYWQSDSQAKVKIKIKIQINLPLPLSLSSPPRPLRHFRRAAEPSPTPPTPRSARAESSTRDVKPANWAAERPVGQRLWSRPARCRLSDDQRRPARHARNMSPEQGRVNTPGLIAALMSILRAQTSTSCSLWPLSQTTIASS
jgi:hypothetical protein